MFSDWQAERVHELNEEIGKLLARAEQLGGEGNVDEAQQVLEKVEKTRALKKEAEVSVGSKVMVEISLWSSVLALDFFYICLQYNNNQKKK